MRNHATFATLLVVALIATVAESSVAQTGEMQLPDNHQVADFPMTHGAQAQENIQLCGVCHARDYCSGCHVNAFEIPAIQALEPNPEVAAYVARKVWPAPASHPASSASRPGSSGARLSPFLKASTARSRSPFLFRTPARLQ